MIKRWPAALALLLATALAGTFAASRALDAHANDWKLGHTQGWGWFTTACIIALIALIILRVSPIIRCVLTTIAWGASLLAFIGLLIIWAATYGNITSAHLAGRHVSTAAYWYKTYVWVYLNIGTDASGFQYSSDPAPSFFISALAATVPAHGFFLTTEAGTLIVTVPLWFLIALMLLAQAWQAFLFWRWLKKRRATRKGLCPACGYDLRASPFRCPECGRPLTPLPTLT